MNHEELVAKITAEVLRRLEQSRQVPPDPHYKVLAVFTGGTIGLEQCWQQLERLQQNNLLFTAVLSAAAEKVIGTEKVKAQMGQNVRVITANEPYPGTELREADMVLVPVLTQNTCAKLASALADCPAVTLLLQALMLGKKVVAVSNAADPNNSERLQKDMSHLLPALHRTLENNLRKVKAYGIELVAAEHLADAVQKYLLKKVEGIQVTRDSSKKVLDAASVRTAAQAGTKTICIEHKTIVTALAKDVARDCRIEIIRQ